MPDNIVFDLQTAKPSWYSALQLPPLVTTSIMSKRNNRISPLMPTVKPEVLSKSITSPTFSHLLKRLTPSTLSKGTLVQPLESTQQHIYLKSPHVVASGELAGSIVIDDGTEDGDTSIMQQFSSLDLSLIGVEVVVDSRKSHIKTFEFLNLPILNVSTLKQYLTSATNKITVPFLVSLPSELGGTYIDKKGSIQYYLYSTLCKKLPSSKPIITKRSVIVYSNMVLKSLKDASTLYTPVLQINKQVWKKADNGLVLIDLTMPRTVWMSGAPIYVTVKVHNATLKDTVVDMKLELVRKQNTYSMNAKDQSIIPVTSSCDTIAQSSLATLGWWKPLEPNSKDRVIFTIEAPSNQVTVRNQKLIDVSYFIRMSISSAQNITEMVTELPVMLVHPISMDPPPGNYTKSASVHKPIEYHLLQDTFQKQQQAAKMLQPSDSLRSLDCTSYKSYSSSTRSSDTSSQLQPAVKRLQSVRKSLSTWGSLITRRMSVSSGVNHQQQSVYRQKLEISSPLMLSSPSSQSYNDSIESTVPSTKDEENITKFIANESLMDSSFERMSVMKFGQIKGPKRFGQQPGCLGDAGLDIRNCFNVATATEAMQSYAAEKVELSDDDVWLIGHQTVRPEDHTDQSNSAQAISCQKLKQMQAGSVVDPSDNCKRDASLKGIQRPDSDVCISVSPIDTQEEADATEMASSSANTAIIMHQNKRMLASSRHLRNVQRKSVQVSKDGRTLLALTNLSSA